MKRTWFFFLMVVLFLSACAKQANGSAENGLNISDGTDGKTYGLADLKAMPVTEAAFKDVNYVGVSLPSLLQAAGYDIQAIKAVKAVASDGFSANYELAIFTREDVIVAYSQADGPLAEEDGAFRIVLPGADGKLNLRMLVKLEVIR